MLAVSILGIKENIKDNIKKLDNLNIDFFHVDIMDGKFVNNKTLQYEDLKEILKVNTKLDVHLMVEDVEEYVDLFMNLNPYNITFHYEVNVDYIKIINKLKEKNIKVGIALKPDTKVEEVRDLLKYIDLVLVMSVEPGFGGQKFIENSTLKIDELYYLRDKYNYNYLIEVDGGINDTTIDLVDKTDIVVVGSFITNGDYEKQIKKINK